MVKKHFLTIPLWERPCTIFIGGGEAEVLKFATQEKYSHETIAEIKADTIDSGTKAAAWWCNTQGEGLMWFPNKRIAKAIIAHEVTHIVDFLLMYIGATSEMEARAYTVEWLFEKIEDLFKK